MPLDILLHDAGGEVFLATQILLMASRCSYAVRAQLTPFHCGQSERRSDGRYLAIVITSTLDYLRFAGWARGRERSLRTCCGRSSENRSGGEESCRTWQRRTLMMACDFLYVECLVYNTILTSKIWWTAKPLMTNGSFSPRVWVVSGIEFPSVTQQHQALSNVAFDIRYNISGTNTTNDIFETGIYFSRCYFCSFRTYTSAWRRVSRGRFQNGITHLEAL